MVMRLLVEKLRVEYKRVLPAAEREAKEREKMEKQKADKDKSDQEPLLIKTDSDFLDKPKPEKSDNKEKKRIHDEKSCTRSTRS